MVDWIRDRGVEIFSGVGVVAVLVIAVFIFLNQEPPPDQGHVRDRSFVPAHDEWDSCDYNTTYDGKTFHCQGGWDHYDDDWDLYVVDCQTDEKGKEKCRSGWVDVGPDVYNQCNLGAFWRKETACAPR